MFPDALLGTGWFAFRDVGRLRTCRNCGCIGHFAERDGVLVCPTPKASVPQSLLRNIRYPFGVTPWRFGNGKGAGKGKGKGGKGGGRGRGRGGYWVHGSDDSWTWEEQVAMDTTDTADDAGQSVDFVVDDYDGFNE